MERVTFLIEGSGEQLSCMLNPERVVLRRTSGLVRQRSLGAELDGATDDLVLRTGGGNTEIELDLLFDLSLGAAAASSPAEDVRELTGALWRLTERSEEGCYAATARLIWGRSWNMRVVVDALAERLEEFSPTGAARRSWLRVRLLRIEEEAARSLEDLEETLPAVDGDAALGLTLDELVAADDGLPGEGNVEVVGVEALQERAALDSGLWDLVASIERAASEADDGEGADLESGEDAGADDPVGDVPAGADGELAEAAAGAQAGGGATRAAGDPGDAAGAEEEPGDAATGERVEEATPGGSTLEEAQDAAEETLRGGEGGRAVVHAPGDVRDVDSPGARIHATEERAALGASAARLQPARRDPAMPSSAPPVDIVTTLRFAEPSSIASCVLIVIAQAHAEERDLVRSVPSPSVPSRWSPKAPEAPEAAPGADAAPPPVAPPPATSRAAVPPRGAPTPAPSSRATATPAAPAQRAPAPAPVTTERGSAASGRAGSSTPAPSAPAAEAAPPAPAAIAAPRAPAAADAALPTPAPKPALDAPALVTPANAAPPEARPVSRAAPVSTAPAADATATRAASAPGAPARAAASAVPAPAPVGPARRQTITTPVIPEPPPTPTAPPATEPFTPAPFAPAGGSSATRPAAPAHPPRPEVRRSSARRRLIASERELWDGLRRYADQLEHLATDAVERARLSLQRALRAARRLGADDLSALESWVSVLCSTEDATLTARPDAELDAVRGAVAQSWARGERERARRLATCLEQLDRCEQQMHAALRAIEEEPTLVLWRETCQALDTSAAPSAARCALPPAIAARPRLAIYELVRLDGELPHALRAMLLVLLDPNATALARSSARSAACELCRREYDRRLRLRRRSLFDPHTLDAARLRTRRLDLVAQRRFGNPGEWRRLALAAADLAGESA
jgi:hypothetical protein